MSVLTFLWQMTLGPLLGGGDPISAVFAFFNLVIVLMLFSSPLLMLWAFFHPVNPDHPRPPSQKEWDLDRELQRYL